MVFVADDINEAFSSSWVGGWTHSLNPSRRGVCVVIDTGNVLFKVSSFCSLGGCVEVGLAANGILMRDTKDRAQKALTFTDEEWVAFVAGVKEGEFDFA
jgi:hypothetical protein